jgi:hypothetical protein
VRGARTRIDQATTVTRGGTATGRATTVTRGGTETGRATTVRVALVALVTPVRLVALVTPVRLVALVTPVRLVALVTLVTLTVAICLGGPHGAALARAHAGALNRGQLLPGTDCPAFPADNVWNTPITSLPVDRRSAAWLAHMDSGTTFLHPDYGPGGGSSPYGIPWQITAPHPRFVRINFLYASQSDRGPYPFSAGTPIEGGPQASGDRHALMVDPTTCVLYELFDATYHPDNRSTAGSGAIWTLRSNHLRPATWTSADAAGLPILPGLVDYDEVESGHIDHAIRFTAQVTDTSFLWPARHEAGAVTNAGYPPMGARFRLKASFHLPRARCARPCQVVIEAMKTYGLILADNGSNWFFQGTTDRRWTYTMVDQLKQIPASAFQAVNESCLMIAPDSGQARQPGTLAYAKACHGPALPSSEH